MCPALPSRHPRFHCLERTHIINDTQPAGVEFSHPIAEEARSEAPGGAMPYVALFREPEFAPGTVRPVVDDEPAPFRRRYDRGASPRRTTRRRAAA